jgi:hypothetical protein
MCAGAAAPFASLPASQATRALPLVLCASRRSKNKNQKKRGGQQQQHTSSRRRTPTPIDSNPWKTCVTARCAPPQLRPPCSFSLATPAELRAVTHPPRRFEGEAMCATDAKKMYVLTDGDLAALDCEVQGNPHGGMFAPMRLFLRTHLQAACLAKHGSKEGLALRRRATWQRRRSASRPSPRTSSGGSSERGGAGGRGAGQQ